jgi:hypothetical protein
MTSVSPQKPSAFVSYRFRRAHEYSGLLEMFERQGVAFVNRSVDPWDPVPLPPQELVESLDVRIRMSTHVIVLVTDDLAKSPCCKLEIETARRYRKPIIAIYPNGEFGAAIPRVLEGGIDRAIGWRGNALERAVRGEYPPEARVFEIAEDVARRKGLALLAGAASVLSVFFAIRLERDLQLLRDELRRSGFVCPESESHSLAPWVATGALGGLALGTLLGARGPELLSWLGIGGIAGCGVAATVHARAEFRRLGPLIEVRRQLAQGS